MNSEKVQEFYERFPYPDKRIETKENLQKNAEWIAKLAEKKIPELKGFKMLDAGCGTGEFACGFALGGAKVLGIDLSAKSIEKAKALAKKFRLENAEFRQRNLLSEELPEKSFDLVYSMGVLHHNPSPKEAFKKISRLVKPEGIIVIGLYNSFGRFPVHCKRRIVELLAGKDSEKKLLLANRLFHKGKPVTEARKAWLADKYLHPLEKTLTIEEVLDWLEKEGFEFLNAKPEIPERKNLLLLQLEWMISGESFFTIAGKKRLNAEDEI
ncbi:MAG: methyltransferase domain-containing protein [Candidatus Diapherotrites archaeon]|nr:methyltransferase domain-containing protein [Candidatus Diapherotrites archaeon]